MQLVRISSAIALTLLVASPPHTASAASCPGQRDLAGQDKIVGGSRARLADWPGFVTLRLRNGSTGEQTYICGASAIGPRWVLTAAHCFDAIEKREGRYVDDLGAVLEVVARTDDLAAVTDTHVRQITNVVIREGYRRRHAARFGRDIALVELARPLGGPFARLSLSTRTDPAPDGNDRLYVGGFGLQASRAQGGGLKQGKTKSGKIFFAGSSRLLEAPLPSVDPATCAARYQGYRIGAGQLCAGLKAGGRDSCQGDSGGPLGAWLRQHVPGVAAQSLVSKAPSAAPAQAIAQVRRLLGPAEGHLSLEVLGEKPLRVGNKVAFRASSDVDGRLIIIDVNADGRVLQIFPNGFVASEDIARISAGRAIKVPGPNYGFDWFRVFKPTGRGRLIGLVVPDSFPMELLVTDAPRMTKGFLPEKKRTSYLMNLVDQILGTLGLKGGKGDAKVKGWAFMVTDYEILD